MKKVFALLLALALLFAVSSLADNTDPIVGSWYMLFDSTLSPEMAPNFQNYDYIICVYSFMSDGTILLTENDIKDNVGTFNTAVCGKWEKKGSNYEYNIIGFGSGKAKVESDLIYLQISENNIYIEFKKMVPFDFYSGYSYK